MVADNQRGRTSTTARKSVARGRPRGSTSGMYKSIKVHSASVSRAPVPVAPVAKDFPLSTVQRYFYDWRDSGLFEQINFELLLEAREPPAITRRAGPGCATANPALSDGQSGSQPPDRYRLELSVARAPRLRRQARSWAVVGGWQFTVRLPRPPGRSTSAQHP